jgi:hypothetical protein
MSELNFFTANAGLSDVAKLEVPELKLMYRIEMAGELFYNILADRVGNDTAAGLLRKNAVEERGHARRLARISASNLVMSGSPPQKKLNCSQFPFPRQLIRKCLPQSCKVS